MPATVDTPDFADLRKALSTPRFETYRRARPGAISESLELYRWNMEVSAAFLVPLHVFEVAVRNAIAEAIESVHGEHWPWSNGFARSLPNPKPPVYSPERDIGTVAKRHATTGKVIADLKFVFWERMLTARHQDRLWRTSFLTAFPNSPTHYPTISDAREALRFRVGQARFLRNRIAHHEPIFRLDLAAELFALHEAVRWRSGPVANWLGAIDPVGEYLDRRPFMEPANESSR